MNAPLSALRKREEQILQEHGASPDSDQLELARLIHELEVQYSELELQNEELRYAVKALEASRNEFFDLYESAPVGFLTVNENGMVELANRAAALMLAAGNRLQGTVFSRLVYTADLDIYFSCLKKVPSRCELRLVASDGRLVHVEMEAAAKHDEKGAHLWRLTIVDFTERKRAEDHLKADLHVLARMHELSRKMLEKGGLQTLLQEVMDTAVAIMGAKHGTLQLLEGDSLRIVAHHGHHKPFLEFFASAENRASACGQAITCGERVIVPDVETSPLFVETPSLSVLREAGVRAVQSTPLKSRTGEVLGILTTQWEVPYTPDENDLLRIDLLARQAADLIEHMQAEETVRESEQRYRNLSNELEIRVRERTSELEHKNRELREFSFVASHDLSEPLRKIQAFGDLLEKKSAGLLGDRERDFISRMNGAAKRMQELLDALLSYSRVDTKSQEFRPAKLDDIVRDAVSDLEVRIVKIGACVEIGPLPSVTGDQNQLRQLFQNLIANSLKYYRVEVRPFVGIHGEEDNDVCRIFVEDHGIGFDEKYLDKIFQPFQRLHGRNEYSGIGMGLAICRKIVDRHHGTITAKSTPGKGSTFIITLPVQQ